MKKRTIVGAISAGVLLLGALGSSASNQNAVHSSTSTPTANTASQKVIAKPTCDGTAVTSSCAIEGVNYKTYIHHPAVAEKTHSETVTTYQEKVTGYCTLCSDGSYSPSCATGRGTCSHHGGVAEWNAPITSNVPVNSTKTIVDAPAQEAYYEKTAE